MQECRDGQQVIQPDLSSLMISAGKSAIVAVNVHTALQEIARAAKIIPALEYASLSTFSVAKYPYPPDAHPIVGWLPGKENVYVAVTHSGATLGPLLGRLIAEEILGNKQDVLEHYRPTRDFSDTTHLY